MIISGNMFQIRVITNFRAYLGLVTNDVITKEQDNTEKGNLAQSPRT